MKGVRLRRRKSVDLEIGKLLNVVRVKSGWVFVIVVLLVLFIVIIGWTAREISSLRKELALAKDRPTDAKTRVPHPQEITQMLANHHRNQHKPLTYTGDPHHLFPAHTKRDELREHSDTHGAPDHKVSDDFEQPSFRTSSSIRERAGNEPAAAAAGSGESSDGKKEDGDEKDRVRNDQMPLLCDKNAAADEYCRCRNEQHYAEDVRQLYKKKRAYLVHRCGTERGEENMVHARRQNAEEEQLHKMCIVVPFRESPNIRNESRSETALLRKLVSTVEHFIHFEDPRKPTKQAKHVWVIVNQTSTNSLRFNHGRLANLGAAVSFGQLGCDYVAIHDVDMLPILNSDRTTATSSNRAHASRSGLSYSYPRRSDMVHLSPAGLHPTYSRTGNYFGGVVLATERALRRSNGFADHVWGWARDDDVLRVRAKVANLKISSLIDNSGAMDEWMDEVLSGKMKESVWQHVHEEGEEQEGGRVRDVEYAEWNRKEWMKNEREVCLFRERESVPQFRDGLWEVSHNETDLIDTERTCLEFRTTQNVMAHGTRGHEVVTLPALEKASVVVIHAALTCDSNLTPHCVKSENQIQNKAQSGADVADGGKRGKGGTEARREEEKSDAHEKEVAPPCWNVTEEADLSCACVNEPNWDGGAPLEADVQRIRACSADAGDGGDERLYSGTERGNVGAEGQEAVGPHKLCVVVPFRNVWPAFEKLVPHLEPFLLRQNIEHVWIVVNQSDDTFRFNRGRLLNLGAVAAFWQFGCDYAAFHDVDLLPISDEIPYTFPEDNVDLYQLSPYYVHPHYPGFPGFFGGNILITERGMRRSNGYSDHLWGWGKEDDIFKLRVMWGGVKLGAFPMPDLPKEERVAKYWRHDHEEDSRPRDMKMLTMNREMLFDIRDGAECLFRDSVDERVQSMFDGYREVERAGSDLWDAQRTCWKELELDGGGGGGVVRVVVIDSWFTCDTALSKHCAQSYNVKPKAKKREKKKST